MQPYNEQVREYTLSPGYSIVRADAAEFGVWYTVYKNSNPYFRFAWDQHLKVVSDSNLCYWVVHEAVRIGGVMIEPNSIAGLYLVPPYCDTGYVLSLLTTLLMGWSDPAKPIVAHGVMPFHLHEYLRLGYRLSQVRRCMIRPTEVFGDDYTSPLGRVHGALLGARGQCYAAFGERFLLRQPATGDQEAVTELLIEANSGSGLESEDKVADIQSQNAAFYFDNYVQLPLHNRASSLVFDTATQQMVGVCLISSWEDWPLVYEVGVRPGYRRRGLAEKMMKRAMSVLKHKHDVIRLFVTVGNPAQALYHRLGFLGGMEAAELYLGR